MAFKRRHKVYSLTLNYKGTPLQFKVRAVHLSTVRCKFYWEGPVPELKNYGFASGRVCNVADRDAIVFCIHQNLHSIWTSCRRSIVEGTSVDNAVLPRFRWQYPEGIHVSSSSYTPIKMYDALLQWVNLNARTMELADISVDYGI
jgi:hypothetical protein